MAWPLPPAGEGCQGEFKRSTGSAEAAWGGAGRASAGAFRSRHHRIGDGEVIEAGFIRPLAGVVSRRALGRIGRRPEAGWGGGEAQMGKDLPDHGRLFDHGNDLHRAPAAGTEQGIHLIDLADQASSRAQPSGAPRIGELPVAPEGPPRSNSPDLCRLF